MGWYLVVDNLLLEYFFLFLMCFKDFFVLVTKLKFTIFVLDIKKEM